ncbi:phospholipase A1 [Microbulbifer thermotolerans]|uniref:phospholipase A n=1 Tax=Microbulbifer thermotolerans TaxID=252514 RepID=UPI0008DEF8AA|nr:phospholipase A [Microbulbifer thermotolerans]SFB67752.1 phospholipase A1 [Microbulbifer thermotolerans]
MPSAFCQGCWVCLCVLFFPQSPLLGQELSQEAAVAPGGGGPVSSHSATEVHSSDRVQAVREASMNRFSLVSHKSNYVLPLSYGDTRDAENTDSPETADWNAFEMEFQFSVQVPVWAGILGEGSYISFAYTNHSFWQAYTSSAPFRESTHEPELMMTWLSDWTLLGLRCVVSQLAISHQSNGRGGEMSRGWNRVYANFVFEREDFFLSVKPWYRIPEEGAGDDNPDLAFYLGNFELEGGYRTSGYGVSVLVRNNLRAENRGAFEVRWRFPLGQRLSGYVKYFNGYGENLINYDRRQQSLGVGFELAQGF